MGLGQNSFLTAGLMGWGMLLLAARPFLAGLVLGAICYKPHFGLLLPLVLVIGGQWRAIAGAAVAVLGLVGLSVALFGLETWQAYLLAMGASRDVYESGAIDFFGMATPFGGALLMGLAPASAHAVQIVALLLTAVLVGWVWVRTERLEARAAALAAGTLLVVHLALFYDVVLVLLAMAFLVRAGAARGFQPGEKTVYAVIYLVLFMVSKWLAERAAEPPPSIPLVPLVSAAILMLCVRRVLKETATTDSGLAGERSPTL